MLKIVGLFLGTLFLFLSSATSASAALFINEFASDTAGTLADPDWVEIYNSGTESADLSLYRLRDNANNLKDLSGVINPGGFAAFDWSSRLDKAGDVIRLLLRADESTPLDQVGYGTLGNDVAAPGPGQSAGRRIDGTTGWVIFINPTKGSSNLVTQTLTFASGWNLVGLTVDKGENYKASDFARDLNSSLGTGSIISIASWDGGFIVHTISQEANDFPIALGKGYFVRSTRRGTSTISGNQPSLSSISILTDWSMISFPRVLTGINNAEELLQAMQNQGIDVQQIARWYAGRWIPHILGSEANNFPITSGEGYMIRNFGNPGTFTLP